VAVAETRIGWIKRRFLPKVAPGRYQAAAVLAAARMTESAQSGTAAATAQAAPSRQRAAAGGGGAGSEGDGIHANGSAAGGSTPDHGGAGGDGRTKSSNGTGGDGSNYGGGGGGSWRLGGTGNSGTRGGNGLIRITYNLPPAQTAPTVTNDPNNETVTYGQDAEFTAAATGDPTPDVSWQVKIMDGDWADISGATSATLTLIKPNVAMSGNQYRAVFTNDAGSAETNPATLTVNKASVTVTLNDLEQTYDGTPKSVTVTTNPVGLSYNITYDGLTVPPTNAGEYDVDVTIDDDNYEGGKTGKLTIGKATAGITLGDLNPTYDGTPKSVTVTTNPVGLSYNITYDGLTVPPTNAGEYDVDVTIDDDNYEGTVAKELVIDKADATISVVGKTVTYSGLAHGAEGTATGADGEDMSALLSLGGTFNNAPGGTANWTFPGDGNHNNASGSVEIVINKADAIISVTGKTVTYDGNAQGATGWALGAEGKVLTDKLNLGAAFANVPGGTANWTFEGDNNHNQASGSVQIVINKAEAEVALQGLRRTYDGNRKAVTAVTDPEGLNVSLTYDGSDRAPREVGGYTVIGTVDDNNFEGSAIGRLVISEEVVPTYVLRVTIVGQGTVGLSSGTYDEGDTISLATVRVTPADGFEFVGWQDANGNSISFTFMGADTEIFAVFREIETIPEEVIPATGDTQEPADPADGAVDIDPEALPAAGASYGWMWWLLLIIPAGFLTWLLAFLVKRRSQQYDI